MRVDGRCLDIPDASVDVGLDSGVGDGGSDAGEDADLDGGDTDGGGPTPPVADVPPTIDGAPSIGAALGCMRGTWTGASSYAYEWRRDGVAIEGAAADTYETTAADIGPGLTCVVTASGDGGSASAESAPVAWTPLALAPDVWLDAEHELVITGDSRVSAWTDLANRRVWSQALDASRPAIRVVGGRTGVDFDGVDDFVRGPLFSALFGGEGPLGIAAVVIPDAVGPGEAFAASHIFATDVSGRVALSVSASGSAQFSIFSTSGNRTASSPIDLGVTSLVLAGFDGATRIRVVAGTSSEGIALSPPHHTSGAYSYAALLGRGVHTTDRPTWFDGVVFALIARRTELGDSERAHIRSWAAYRWGI